MYNSTTLMPSYVSSQVLKWYWANKVCDELSNHKEISQRLAGEKINNKKLSFCFRNYIWKMLGQSVTRLARFDLATKSYLGMVLVSLISHEWLQNDKIEWNVSFYIMLVDYIFNVGDPWKIFYFLLISQSFLFSKCTSKQSRLGNITL